MSDDMVTCKLCEASFPKIVPQGMTEVSGAHYAHSEKDCIAELSRRLKKLEADSKQCQYLNQLHWGVS